MCLKMMLSEVVVASTGAARESVGATKSRVGLLSTMSRWDLGGGSGLRMMGSESEHAQ